MAKKHKTNIKINGPNDEKILEFTLNTDEDVLKLMKTSSITGKELLFQGKQVENTKINGINIKGSSKILIGNPSTYFNIKVGDTHYPEIPFKRKKLPKNKLLFTTTSAKLGIKMQLEMEFIKNHEVNINITISSISDNIKDLLRLERIKKEWYGKPFEIKIEGIDEDIARGKFDFLDYTEWLIEFYEKVDCINEKLDLNLTHPETYEITKEDLESAQFICHFLKYKKIPFNSFTIRSKIPHSELRDIVTNNEKEFHLKKVFKTKLLEEEIILGEFNLDITQVIYLNFKELLESYNENKKEKEEVDIQLIILSMKPEENYLNFYE